jgi:hypothetical protein
MMSAMQGLAGALLVAVAAMLGCAQKTDWIGGTLVTVDVTGLWRGSAFPQRGVQAEVEMTLSQNGPKVTGEGRFRATKVKIEGTIRGDVLSFSEPGGRLRADATVTGDEMSGPGWSRMTNGDFTLKLSRQP